MSTFDIEAAKRGEPVEYRIGKENWIPVHFVGAAENGKLVCQTPRTFHHLFVPEDGSLRIAPKKIKVRYRVALLKYEGCNPYTRTADTEERAKDWEIFPAFVRWLTDWQETEIEQ